MFSLIPRFRIRRLINSLKWKVQNFGFLFFFIAAMWWYTDISGPRMADPRFILEQGIVGGGDLSQLIDPPYRLLTHALLHGGHGHLMGNTMGFMIFASAAIISAERDWVFFLIFFGSLLGGALGGILMMPQGVPGIGASGVTYGFKGFVFAIGLFRRSFPHLALSGLALFYFGGSLIGATPLVRAGIGWEAHLGGLLAGAGAACYLARICNDRDVEETVEREIYREKRSRRNRPKPPRKKRRRK